MKRSSQKKLSPPKSKFELETMFLDNSQMKMMFKVSDTTLWRWRKDKILKFKKITGKYYYPYDLVINFMRSGMEA